jgi:hypothetical protein
VTRLLEDKSHRITMGDREVIYPAFDRFREVRQDFRPAVCGPYLPVVVQNAGFDRVPIFGARILPN